MTAIVEAYRRHPARLLVTSLAVFGPLGVIRFFLVQAGWFPVAIALTVAGHLVLAAILRRRRRPVPRAAGVAGLLVLTVLEIVAGRGIELVFGMSALVVTLGGSVPSVLIGPAWALTLLGLLPARAQALKERRGSSPH